ncbi:hypothetical protein TNCV_952281 [Trichonephila clavipes]|nr:hypothetical protein TNCV_952281 [Trichonephila clavipes]
MAQKCSVNAGSRRCPVHVLYNTLDLATINSWILYKEVTGKKTYEEEYLQQLIEELRIFTKESTSQMHRQKRIQLKNLRRCEKAFIAKLSSVETQL